MAIINEVPLSKKKIKVLPYCGAKLYNKERCTNKPSLGSETAKSGIKAEEIFRTNEKIKKSLETHFDKKITKIVKAPARKKYDNIIYFEDKTHLNTQNKKIINLGGRGDSFDRRHIKHTFENEFIRKYLTLLTLIRENKRETLMSNIQKNDFIKLCKGNLNDIKQYIKKTLIGENDGANECWCIMKTDKRFINIELYVINSDIFHNFINNSINVDIKLKKNGTCLHLSPHIALQRKGGGKTDKNPNHIQAKLKITQDILNIFKKIL